MTPPASPSSTSRGKSPRRVAALIVGVLLACGIVGAGAWVWYDTVVPPKRLRQELRAMVTTCTSRALAEEREMRRRHDAVSPREFADSSLVALADSGAELRMPDSLSIGLSLLKHLTTKEMIALAGRAPRLSLGVASAAPYDPFILGALSADRGARARSGQRLGRREYRDLYREVAGAPLCDTGMLRPVYFLHCAAFPVEPTGVKVPPPAFTAVFHTADAARRYPFYPMRVAGVMPVPDQMRGPCSYALYLRPQIDTAAAIVARYHPGIHADNVRLLLIYHIVSHQNEMTDEDPFQDCAAARWAGYAHRDRLEAACARFPSKEIAVGKFRVRVPLIAWNIASLLPRYALDRQGLGPNQIIIGYARRAAAEPGLAVRYAPFLDGRDFASSKALVRAVLDPVKAVLVTALVYDYILTRLERGPFADKTMRMPVDIAPYCSNDASAREYALLLLTQRLSLYPEFDAEVPGLLTYKNPPLYAHLAALGDIFGIAPHFPGLFGMKWTMPGQRVYATYWRENAAPVRRR